MAKSVCAVGLAAASLAASWLAAPAFAQSGARAARSIPAVVVTRDRAVLSSEIPGRIVALPAGVGASFRKGDLLVEFDCRYYNINRDKAAHESEAARKKHENIAKLGQMASAGQLMVELAEIEYRKSLAELRGADLMVERCIIRAPFEGSVVRLYPQTHETIAVGQPVIEIAGTDRIEIEAAVPPALAASLSREQDVVIRLDGLDADVRASITGIAPVIDSVSQLVTVRAIIKQRDPRVIPGMTGVLRVKAE